MGNQAKAYAIIHHFLKTQKSIRLSLYRANCLFFFSQLLVFHGLKDKSKSNAAKALGVNPYFIEEYFTAARIYPMKKK